MHSIKSTPATGVIARLDRAIQYTPAVGILDCPVKPGNDTDGVHSPYRHW